MYLLLIITNKTSDKQGVHTHYLGLCLSQILIRNEGRRRSLTLLLQQATLQTLQVLCYLCSQNVKNRTKSVFST